MATKLCTPVIGGVVSNLCGKVFVANCVPGATIFIRSLTRPGDVLIKAPIDAPDGFLDLAPGASLLGGDRLAASQADPAGNASSETHPDLAVVVSEAPTNAADITPVDITGRLWQCGRHGFVAGAIPGATVEVLRGGTVLGSAVAQDGTARLTYTGGLNANEQVEVRQRVGAAAGASLPRDVTPLPGGNMEALPPPLILGPVRACQTAVRLDGVYEGADVTLTRKSGEVETAPFDLSGLWFRLGTPLTEANGFVKAKQTMPSCRRDGQEAVADIGPPVKPLPPFVYPLCAGMVSVFIDNVERGAEVRITVGADVYTTFAAASGYNRFDVEPLPAGPITVQSLLCGLGSDLVTATVESAPATIDQPQLRGPLVKCQRSVTVDMLKPGAVVQVWAKGPSVPERPISSQRVVIAATMEIDVTTLPEGADVWAVQWACALVHSDSNHLGVGPSPIVNDPDFTTQLTRIDKTVTVKGTLRDAIVEILRKTGEQSELIGSAKAKGPSTTVTLQVVLAVGQELQVRQRYCAVQSPGRTRMTVVKPVPLEPVILMPGNGQSVPVNTVVSLAWKDPAAGADADRKADTFDISVVRDGSNVLSQAVSATTVSVPQPATAAFSATFSWSVTPRNSTGAGITAHSTFSTPKAPDPTITAVQDQGKIKVTGSGFASSHAVEIDIAIEYHALAGSPQAPVEVNDNRTGNATATSSASGTLDTSFNAADALEPRTELTGTGGATQNVKAPPYPTATVRVKAHNKPPITPSQGSSATSKTVVFSWS